MGDQVAPEYAVVGSVEKISEQCLMPVLEKMLENFPFVILDFYDDNGLGVDQQDDASIT